MEWISFAIALVSAGFSIVTYFTTVRYERKKATIEAINLLQNEVLDKFVSIKNENAHIIVENLDDARCREAYNDCRALIARLEHFSVGVNRKIYDFSTLDNLVGIHFVCLYKKIKPIIDEANKNEKCIRHYSNFVKLISNLERQHIKQNSWRK